MPPRLKSLLRSARRLVYDDVTVVVYGLELKACEKAAPPNMVLSVGAAPPDVRHLMQSLGDWDNAVMARRKARGDACITPIVDGCSAGFTWVTSAVMEIEEVGMTRPLAKGHSWIYHCHISTPYRGRGLYLETLRYILSEMAHRGGSVAWIGAEDRNISSRRGIEKAGFRTVGHFRRVRVLGFTTRFETVINHADPLSFALKHANRVDRRTSSLCLGFNPERRAV